MWKRGGGPALGENYGSLTHAHKVAEHGHFVPHQHRSPEGCTTGAKELDEGGDLTPNRQCHTHGMSGGTMGTMAIEWSANAPAAAMTPPFYTLKFLRAKKNLSNKYPDGAVTWRHIITKWDGTILVKGRYSLTDGHFVKGDNVAGNTGGSNNHIHDGPTAHRHPDGAASTHTHSLGGGSGGASTHGGSAVVYSQHEHGATVDDASAIIYGGDSADAYFDDKTEEFIPRYQNFISYISTKKNKKNRVECGDILMFIDTGPKFKYKHWLECDGVQTDPDTGLVAPNLKQSRYFRCDDNFDIGGEAQHRHLTPATHFHTGMGISEHQHNVTTTSTTPFEDAGFHDLKTEEPKGAYADVPGGDNHKHDGMSTTDSAHDVTSSEEVTYSTWTSNTPLATVVGFRMATKKAERPLAQGGWIINRMIDG